MKHRYKRTAKEQAFLTMLGSIRDAIDEYLDYCENEYSDPWHRPLDDVSQYVSDDVPRGFETILGYLATEEPDMLDLLEDPVRDTMQDGRKLARMCKREGITTHKVTAPPIAEHRFEQVTAYPLEVLREYFESL